MTDDELQSAVWRDGAETRGQLKDMERRLKGWVLLVVVAAILVASLVQHLW